MSDRNRDIEAIEQVLRAGKDADVKEIEVDLPYHYTSNNQGKFKIKATYR